MANPPAISSAEIDAAYRNYDREMTIRKFKVACTLGMILMPAGFVLDWYVYRDQFGEFLLARFLSSGLIGCFFALILTNIGRKYYRVLGVTLVILPAAFIAWMIYRTDGVNSPYYAGLNLVLLVLGFVLNWTLRESVVAVGSVTGMYLLACGLNEEPSVNGAFFNNMYFLVLTGIIAATGNYFNSKLRKQEFTSRFELDRSRGLLEESNRKLVELDQLKSRFFANISHELRTPLTLLIAPLESMLKKHGNRFDADTLELMAGMQANGMRLLKLINDLLDLVRLESGRMNIKEERFDLPEFLHGLGTSVRKMAEDKGLKIHIEAADEIRDVVLDRDKLEKILLNLTFNAIKFTPAGGHITTKAMRSGNRLILNVTDTGMGISQENLPYVFDRFWQADTSSQRKYQGVGIGLALVKELIEVQGGKITVASELKKGTSFTIDLPYRTEFSARNEEPEADAVPVTNDTQLAEAQPTTDRMTPAAPVAEQTDEWLVRLYRRAELFPSMTSVHDSMRPVEMFGFNGQSNGQSKLLIADDEPDMLRFLKSQLKPHYQIIEAVDGQQAIDKTAQFLPDVVLCDMMMPEKDGLQVCQELRARTSTQGIPILLLTARADEETKYACLTAGASDFLAKPFSTTELHVRLKNLVDSHLLQRKLFRQNQILESTLEQLKETETQLVQSEKLASLGRMSAGIIHEINNPLNFAKTGLHMLKMSGQSLPEAERSEFEDTLKDVEDGINRVRNIVTDLRGFTHPNTEDFDTVELHKIVTSALRFLSHETKDGVKLDVQIPEDFTIWANSNQVIQVLVNLMQNALDAMRRRIDQSIPSEIHISAVREHGLVALKIRDNGEGIPADILNKIFDPFFTTKDVGEGMGLGLSICYRIMEQHEGRIQVDSEWGKYCEFTLEFPDKM